MVVIGVIVTRLVATGSKKPGNLCRHTNMQIRQVNMTCGKEKQNILKLGHAMIAGELQKTTMIFKTILSQSTAS